MTAMTTRTLFLLRHAKASRDDAMLDDFDRPLTERGIEDAALMGQLIADRGWWPARALVSPAMRTRQTWTLTQRELPPRRQSSARPADQRPAPPAIPRADRPLYRQHRPGNPPDNVPEALYMPALYSGDADILLSLLLDVPASVSETIVVGHNPALEDLAVLLASSDSDNDALTAMRKKFPTGALAVFTFETEWKELGPARARLTEFLKPKALV